MARPGPDAERIAAPSRGAGLSFGIVAALLAVAAVIGAVLVFRFVEAERQRDLRGWQVRLGIVADSRFAAVDDWIEAQYDHLGSLARNASLQIYMTEVMQAGGDPEKATGAAAQAGYLRNLLVVTASRGGFTGRPAGPDVPANVERVGVAGIALVDLEGRLLVSTAEMPPLEGRLRDFVASAPRGSRALLDLYKGPAGRPTMGFMVPVFAVQGDTAPSDQIGMILGVKEVDDELYPLLEQPGATQKTAETMLVRRREAVVEYISPLADGTRALSLRMAMDTPDLAAAFAVRTPGGFGIRRDYRGREVLVTGRAFANAPWTLVHKVDRAEALAESDTRLRRLLVILLLSIAVVSIAVLAVWWQGSSRRAREAAARYRDLAREYESQRRFLQLVTDSQPNAIFIVDGEEGRLRFANRTAAARAGIDAADMIGKTMAAVFGPEEAKRYREENRRALEAGHGVSAVVRLEADGGPRILHSEHIPLEPEAGRPRGLLVVERDITQTVLERERRERTLRQLVRTLVAVVDRRDPYAAHHSVRVGMVARATAEEMGLEPSLVETAEIAGILMNLGKILVPEEVLTKAGSLSEDEMRQVRASIEATADLLEGIEFDGPVVETLRQLHERWDGTGEPRGLAGDEILVTARVVAVANAFVAMVSPRAWRPGTDFDRAVERLFAEIGAAFDRRVVAALVNYLDNRGGRRRWSDFVTPQIGP